MTDKPTPRADGLIERSGIRVFASSPREAYEKGMPLSMIKQFYHLSDSEAQDVAPEEFEDEPERSKVSGY